MLDNLEKSSGNKKRGFENLVILEFMRTFADTYD